MVLTSGTVGPGHGHRALAEAALRGGATAVQLRAPELPDRALLELAVELAELCRASGALFVVNDRLDVAVASEADGVHLGQSDGWADARERFGPDRILGVSVADGAQAQAAATMGADYVGVTVWSTSTKPQAQPRGPAGIRAVCQAVAIPAVGIGGIDRYNFAQVFQAGASGIAVISAVAGAVDPEAATRDLRTLIDLQEKESDGTTNR